MLSKIKLKTDRQVFGGLQKKGEIVEISAKEADRLVKLNLAEYPAEKKGK